MFKNTSQICVVMKCVYIHENIYEAVQDALIEYAKTVIVRDPLDPSNEIRPVQNQMQFEKVKCIFAHDTAYNTMSNINSYC